MRDYEDNDSEEVSKGRFLMGTEDVIDRMLHHIPTSGNMEVAGDRRSYSHTISRETV